MAVVKNLMVRAGADFSEMTTQAARASKSMRGMQQSVSRSCNIMTKAAGGLKKTLSVLGVGVSVAAIVKYGKEAAEAYDNQIESEMRLATVMRNTMGATNKEIQSIMDLTAAEQALGIVGDEVQLAGAQQLSTYLHLSSSLKTLIPVMNDLAVQQYGFNVSADQAASIAKLLGKAMEGQTSALTRYGFAVSDAQAETLKYGTETERAAVLADIVSQKVGGMNAALAATPTGRMKQLSNAMGDVKENFGQAVLSLGTLFLPAINAVGRALAGIATLANATAGAMAKVFGGTAAGKEWQWAGVGIEAAADSYDDLSDAQDRNTAATKRQRKELQLASIDTLQILKNNQEAGSSGGSYSVGSIGAVDTPLISTEATGEAEENVSSLQAKLEDFFSRVKGSWEDLRDWFPETWAEIKGDAGTAWDWIAQKAADIGARVKGSWESLKSWGSETWAEIKGDVLSAWDRIKNGVAQKVESMSLSVQLKFQSLKLKVSGVVDKIRKLMDFQWDLPHLKMPHLSWGSRPAGGWIADVLSTLGLPTSLPTLNVSWYAKGGIFDRPSLIGVGESGREAVVPLERNTGWIRQVANELASGMTGSGIMGGDALIAGIRDAVYEAMVAAVTGRTAAGRQNSVKLYINGREFARATYDDQVAVAREHGVSLIKT